MSTDTGACGLAAIFAPTIEVLIGARFMQGVGTAVGWSISRALVRDPGVLETWKSRGHVALCYVPRDGANGHDPTTVKLDYPENPNGAFELYESLGYAVVAKDAALGS